MAATKSAPAPETNDVVEVESEKARQGWEFIGTPPTREQIEELLGNLPATWGVEPSDFYDYLTVLSSTKDFRHQHEGGAVTRDSALVYTPYFSVAGRVKMLEQAQRANGWRVDFRPELVTPTGSPGYLSMEERIIYRVYVEIFRWNDSFGRWETLGTRSGTAWVPYAGGTDAARSNPYEKVETSALGRALAAWGFGVLPGSGVASVEEMASAREAAATARAERPAAPRGETNRPERGDVLEKLLMHLEDVRLRANLTEAQALERNVAFLAKVGARDFVDESGAIVWDKIKDGQLQLMSRAMSATLADLAYASEPGADPA